MEETTNLKLPLLVPNQSQKEITHNEALIIIDNLMNNGVKDKDLTTPPENPSQNDLYIVGVGATGEWVGKDNQLAFYDNGWRFCQARQGTKYWVIDENCIYVFNMTSWSKFSGGEGGGSSGSGEGGATSLSQLDDVSLNSISQDDILKFSNGVFTNSKELNNLTGLGINCECDNDNKLAIKSNYVLFDNNGGDSKIKANKSTTTQTASHLFQDNYSGRAEFGLIGNDDFSLKVSSDGSEWKEAFVVDKATGNIDFKQNLTLNNKNVSSFSFPSSTYINLTVLDSGLSYTAPADGWYFALISAQANKNVDLRNQTTGMMQLLPSSSSTAIAVYLPANKNDIIQLSYLNGTVFEYFRFIYNNFTI